MADEIKARNDATESIERVNEKVRSLVGRKTDGDAIDLYEDNRRMTEEAFIAIADALADVGVVIGLDVKEPDDA